MVDEVDEVAVAAYARGRRVTVTDEERLHGIVRAVGYGVKYAEVDQAHGLYKGSTQRFVLRMRREYEEQGRVFPEMPRPSDGREFTELEVVDVRTRSVAGTSDHVLAVEYDTTPEDIGHICRGRRYGQYGGPVRAPRQGPSRRSREHWVTGDYQFPEKQAS